MPTNVILSKNGIQVTLSTTMDEEILNNAAQAITYPNSKANWGSGAKDVKILDLQRIERKISVEGWLANGFGSGDTNSNATDKKTNLRTIFKSGGTTSMTYEGSTFTGIMDKLAIKRVADDSESNPPDKGEYFVKFSIIEGVNL